MADQGTAVKFTGLGFFTRPEGVTDVELTLAGTAPAAGASFSLMSPRDLTLAGAAPAAGGSFRLAQPADLTLAGVAPAATAQIDLGLPITTLALQADAPAATGAMAMDYGDPPPEDLMLVDGNAPVAQASFDMAWVVVYQMHLEVLDPTLKHAPTALTVLLTDAKPLTDVAFDIDDVQVAVLRASSTGQVGPVSLNVPVETGAAGSHTLTATQAGSLSASGTFTLARGPYLMPRSIGMDAQAVSIPGSETSTGVQRWVLQDLMPGGLGSYVMPMNPRTMTDPYYERSLESFHTTALDGQFHVFEGSEGPTEWQFDGYCPTRQMHDQLLAYSRLNRRFYIIDHRGRAWKVAIANLDLVARRRERTPTGGWNDWAHDYSVTALVYDRRAVSPA